MTSICKGSTKNFLPSPTCPSAHSAQEWVHQMRFLGRTDSGCDMYFSSQSTAERDCICLASHYSV